MKQIIRPSLAAILLAGTLITSPSAFAQRVEATETTITADGSISTFGPQSILIKTELGVQPVRYLLNETSNYVNQDGQPIAAASVKAGTPVTVYYTKIGDTLVASKVMVKSAVIAPTLVVETSSTTSAGTISEFGPESLLITSDASPEPQRYAYSKTTTYVDETGQPVSVAMVKSGLPVTVYYARVGNTLVASKVIVRKAIVIPNPITEQKRTTTTTTTIEK